MNMQKLLYLYCLFFLTINASAQEVRGRVMNDTIPLAGTHVLNLANNAVTTTDANGYFSIKARTILICRNANRLPNPPKNRLRFCGRTNPNERGY